MVVEPGGVRASRARCHRRAGGGRHDSRHSGGPADRHRVTETSPSASVGHPGRRWQPAWFNERRGVALSGLTLGPGAPPPDRGGGSRRGRHGRANAAGQFMGARGCRKWFRVVGRADEALVAGHLRGPDDSRVERGGEDTNGHGHRCLASAGKPALRPPVCPMPARTSTSRGTTTTHHRAVTPAPESPRRHRRWLAPPGPRTPTGPRRARGRRHLPAHPSNRLLPPSAPAGPVPATFHLSEKRPHLTSGGGGGEKWIPNNEATVTAPVTGAEPSTPATSTGASSP